MNSKKYPAMLALAVVFGGYFAFGHDGHGLRHETKAHEMHLSPNPSRTVRPRVPKVGNCPFQNGILRKWGIYGPHSYAGFDILGSDSIVRAAIDGKVQAMFYIGGCQSDHDKEGTIVLLL